jgi:nitrate/nitrite transport system substrate-binding protein
MQQKELQIKEAEVMGRLEIERERLDLDRAKSEGNIDVQRERIRSEDRREGARIGVRVASQIEDAKHKDKTDPKSWKGLKFAIPFDYSMHNYLLRYYLAEAGLDPDQDVQIRAVPPPEMVANLRADNIDGFLAPDNVAQRAVFDGVGFIHTVSKQLWDGHPCCVFAVSREFIATRPNTYAALLRAIVDATAYSSKQENRKQIAEVIAPAAYLNAPPVVLEQVLTGTFADGLGRVQRVPDRIGFDPFPWHSMAMWIMTQMRRWGQLQRDVDYRQVAEQVFLATDAARAMRDLGQPVPSTTTQSFQVMGRTFDPANPAPWTERNIRAS